MFTHLAFPSQAKKEAASHPLIEKRNTNDR